MCVRVHVYITAHVQTMYSGTWRQSPGDIQYVYMADTSDSSDDDEAGNFFFPLGRTRVQELE